MSLLASKETLVLLTVSILYASIFAIGMIITIRGNLVVPLCGLGLFIISYFTIYPKAFWTMSISFRSALE